MAAAWGEDPGPEWGPDPSVAHTSFIKAWEDKQLGILRSHYPDWVIWVVREFPGLTYWSARRRGELAARFTVESPEELVQKMAGRPMPAG